eukprot:TRINITY_DN7015_c0_g1_i1.p1 TRINITY_DN7015_c0_g1~~TRINITY_DN7015_c0_g1_i1.p1  ORF type:complete len:308 (-),score=58.81 TRINITY_DN7015_c0_g1_i1:94-1017(-)
MLVHRLKDKLGTRTLPTAEIELNSTVAELVGEVGKGVKTISHLFNITRIWTCISSASTMYRLLSLARDYASKRKAFGKPLSQLPVHVLSMARLEVEVRACLQLVVKLVLLLGEEECEGDSKSAQLLRILTPVCKLFTAKQTMTFVQEALESFGSPGYMEDTGLPRAMRDAQVNTIWEGTTNVLSLDVIRAIGKDPMILHVYVEDVTHRVQKNTISSLDPWCATILQILQNISSFPLDIHSEFRARDLAFTLARVYSASLLLEQANWSNNEDDVYAVHHWCSSVPLSCLDWSPATETKQAIVRRLARL